MKSIAKKVAVVGAFPDFSGQGVYMHKTGMDELVLPASLRDYVPVLDTMLSSLKDRAAVCYITIDEKVVANTTHRRAGAHVDHNWYENIVAHSGSGGHTSSPPLPDPRWRNNNGHLPAPSRPSSPGHSSRPAGTHNSTAMDEFNGGMLLTSNYPACQIWAGDFEGLIGEGGCCKDIDLTGLATSIMPANEVFYLNPLGIHESLPIKDTVKRQLVRVNFHTDYIPELL